MNTETKNKDNLAQNTVSRNTTNTSAKESTNGLSFDNFAFVLAMFYYRSKTKIKYKKVKATVLLEKDIKYMRNELAEELSPDGKCSRDVKKAISKKPDLDVGLTSFCLAVIERDIKILMDKIRRNACTKDKAIEKLNEIEKMLAGIKDFLKIKYTPLKDKVDLLKETIDQMDVCKTEELS